jgi:hypothetical protein
MGVVKENGNPEINRPGPLSKTGKKLTDATIIPRYFSSGEVSLSVTLFPVLRGSWERRHLSGGLFPSFGSSSALPDDESGAAGHEEEQGRNHARCDGTGTPRPKKSKDAITRDVTARVHQEEEGCNHAGCEGTGIPRPKKRKEAKTKRKERPGGSGDP